MSENPSDQRSDYSRTRQAAADCIIQALENSDIAEICHAIGADTRLYNISDLAHRFGMESQNVYRAFAGGPKHPNFTTVLNALDAVGFRLHVTVLRGVPARATRALKPVPKCQESER
jgi:probable addiction module antidote protein